MYAFKIVRKLVSFAAYFCLLAVLVSQAAAQGSSGSYQPGSPWPKFQGDNGNSGVGVGSGANGTLAWTFSMGQEGFPAPSIGADGTVYVGNENVFYALDGKTSAIKWSFTPANPGNFGSAIGADGTVYVSCIGGSLYALDPATGQIKWSFNAGEYRSVNYPVIGPDGTVYACSSGGGLDPADVYALDGSTGAVKWSIVLQGTATCPGTTFLDSCSPALGANGILYCNMDIYPPGPGRYSSALYAIDSSDGSLVFTVSEPNVDMFASPAIGQDGTVYLGTADGFGETGSITGLFAFDGLTGAQKWELPCLDGVACSPAIGKSGVLYLASDDNLYAINSGDGNILWTFTTTQPVYALTSAPTVGSDGTVYVGFVGNGPYAVNGSSGALEWTTMLPSSGGGVQTVAIGADGSLFLGSGDGSVDAIASPALANFYASPSAVGGGTSARGVVQVSLPTAPNDLAVALSSGSSDVTVPASITVAGGGKGVSFPITTARVSAPETVTLTATLNNVSLQATLTLNPSSVANFYASPSAVTGGAPTRGVVQLSSPAGPDDMVSLACPDPAVQLPSSVTISPNSTGVSFPITTSSVAAPDVVTLTASFAGTEKQTTLILDPIPALVGFSVNNAAPFMTYRATGTVTLSSAPLNALALQATSNDRRVTVSSQPVVSPGHTTATFLLTANPVPGPGDGSATISVSLGSVTLTQSMQVRPIVPASLSFSPSLLHAGQSGTLVIKSAEMASAGSFPISITGGGGLLTVPSSATMAQGTYSLTVPVAAAPTVTAKQVVVVSVTIGGVQISGNVTIEP